MPKLLLLLFLILLVPSQSLDIYVDSVSSSPVGLGTPDDLFKTLDQAFALMNSFKTQEKSATIFLKKAENSQYIAQDLITIETGVNETMIESLTISAWNTSVITLKSEEEDCSILPTIDGSLLNWKFVNMTSVKLIGLNIIDLQGEILINSTKEVVLSNSCLKNSRSGTKDVQGLNLWNINQLTIEDTILMIDAKMTKFVSFINNEAKSQILLKSISVIVSHVDTLSSQTMNPCFDFAIEKKGILEDQKLTIQDIKIKLTGNDQILPFIGKFSGFNDVDVEGFYVENQNFYMAQEDSVTAFQFLNNSQINIAKVSFVNNTVVAKGEDESSLSLFTTKNCQLLNLTEVEISNNNFLLATEAQKLLFGFINMTRIYALEMKNMVLKSNKFEGKANIINFSGPEPFLFDTFQMNNITLHNNSNTKDDFDFLTIDGIVLTRFNLIDFKFIDNDLTGSIFSFEKLDDQEKKNKILSFSNIFISNCQSSDLTLFYLNAVPETNDLAPILQWTTVLFSNLSILNSSFRGKHSLDWQDEDALFEVLNAKLYVDSSRVAGNTFDSFDFIVMKSQTSSVFLVNCNFDENSFTRASIIVTKFDQVFPLDCGICRYNTRSVNLQYRFTYVLSSNFTNLKVQKTPLFMINTPYIIMGNNTFKNVEFGETELIVAEKFYPHTCANKEPILERNLDIEQKVFSGFDLKLLKTFQELMTDNQMAKKYFYMISSNKFENLTLKDKGIIMLKDYNFNEGSVILQGNNFTKVFTESESEETIDMIQTGGQILNFIFLNNIVETVHFTRSIVRFSEFVNNTMLVLKNNSVNNYTGDSAFIVSGTNLNTTIIMSNNVTNSNFTSSIFNIEVIQNKGIQTWSQNIIAGNSLNALDKSLLDVPDSRTMIKPMNPMKISKTIQSFIVLNVERNEGNFTFDNNTMKDNIVRRIDNSFYHKLSFLLVAIQESHKNSLFVMTNFQFLNNTYLNPTKSSFMKELNGLFSLLVGNCWCIINKCRFEGVHMYSKGNSLFYVAANKTSIFDNIFKNITAHNENSIFDLMTVGAKIHENRFQDIELKGAGVFLMNQASPREGIDYTPYTSFDRNHFEKIKIAGIEGSIVVLNSKFLSFSASSNTIIDSFDGYGKSLFYLKDSSCYPCLFKNNSFIIKKSQDGDTSLLYRISHCEGEVSIVDTRIHHENSLIHFDSLLIIEESPLMKAKIQGLEYVKPENKHVGLRLVQIDSGNLTVKDLEVKDMKYEGDENLIQVWGGDSNTPLYLNVLNLTAKNLTLESSFGYRNGLISFDSYHEENKKYPLNFEMSKSKFMDIQGISAVSLKVSEMESVSIEDCVFERIESPKGPAINSAAKFGKDKPLKISRCNMTSNTAEKVGGAIYMNPTNYLITENVFTENKAQNVGGAIYLADQAIDQSLIESNTFVQNSAQFGDIIGSSIKGLQLKFTFEEDMGQYIDVVDEKIIIRNASSIGIEFTSLDIGFVDFNGQRTLDLNRFTPFLIMNFKGRTNRQLASTNCVEAGCFIPEFNLILSGKAGEIINVDIEYQSAILYPLVNNWKTSFAIELRGCVDGEHYNENTITCDYCPKGTFSMNPDFPCQNCPLNADCSGGNSVLPKTGFWKSDSETVVAANLHECKQDGILRCEGGSKGCANGFTGVKCQQCDFENGYVESGLLNCKKCKDFWHSLLLSGGGMLLYMIYKAVCIGKMYSTNEIFASSQNSSGKKFYRACEKGYYVKLLMIYTQILSLVFLFNGEVKGTMTTLLQIGNPSEFILVNLQCSLRAVGVHPQDFLYVSSFILLVSPVIQILLIILIAKIFVKSFFPSLKMSQFARLTILCVILAEQPGIVGNLTAFLSCSHDKITGGDYITLHPNWSCNDPRYLFFKKYLVIPVLAFWAVVIPLFMFFSLYLRRKNLEQLEVRGTWGALYNLAKTSHYYWGTVVMILGLSISFVSYTFQEDSKTSAFAVFVLLLTYQFSVKLVKPFRFATFNFVETVAFNLLMLSVILGYFGNDMDEKSLKQTAYGILVVLNTVMLLFLGFKVFDLVALEYLFKIVKKLKSWFGVKDGAGTGKKKAESQEENSEGTNYVELTESNLTKSEDTVTGANDEEKKKE